MTHPVVDRTRPVRRFGDGAVVADADTPHEAHALATSVRAAAWEGVEEVVVGYRSVTLVANPRQVDPDQLCGALASLAPAPGAQRRSRRVEVPVAFDGPDIEEVARLAGTEVRHLVEALTDCDLEAAFLGFAPGFAYLVGLPEFLQAIPRRATPRAVVERGSVALGGGFAAIYPSRSPGGWRVVGRTNLEMFDPETPPYALVQPGDVVRLVESDLPRRDDQRESEDAGRAVLRVRAPRNARVERAGALSLVEDGGRRGLAALGVPRSGAADPVSMRLANRLVGNPDETAVIELTAFGPSLRFGAAAHACVVGDVEVSVDERSVPANTVVPLEPGQLLSVGRVTSGLRAYLALDGGVEVPEVLGSRSTDVLSGLGIGPLRLGDEIGIGQPQRARGWLDGTSPSLEKRTLRLTLGPEEFDGPQIQKLVGSSREVGVESDRVGLRLIGDAVEPRAWGIESRAVVTGAVQVPPDGNPIVLLCDHATVGGYPVVGTVITADLGALGQLSPGDAVRFEVVSYEEARAALAEEERALDAQVRGWYPSRTD